MVAAAAAAKEDAELEGGGGAGSGSAAAALGVGLLVLVLAVVVVVVELLLLLLLPVLAALSVRSMLVKLRAARSSLTTYRTFWRMLSFLSGVLTLPESATDQTGPSLSTWRKMGTARAVEQLAELTMAFLRAEDLCSLPPCAGPTDIAIKRRSSGLPDPHGRP